MTYVRIDDHFPQHRKALGLDDAAFAMHIRAICYCSTQLTDGLVARKALPLLSRHRKPEALAASLVAEGLWEPREDGWEVHDYLDWQESAASVLAKRDAARERMKRRRSQNVQANKEGSSQEVQDCSQEVREQETETETETERTRTKAPPGAVRRSPPDPKTPNGFVDFYVLECRAKGYDPVRQWRDAIGSQAKRISAEKSPDLIRSAIRVMADERKQPGVLAHVIADIEAGRSAANGST